MNETYWYPFAAVSGQHQAKRALLITLVNPKAGGVLISGAKGTAKSTLVYGLGSITGAKTRIDLPLNVTEDMLFGSIDLETAIVEGIREFSPGILSRADKNILYIDEVNLLQRDLLTAVLESNARGFNLVERDGISCRHPVSFTVIATMNPEEGSLPPQILDRFGLFCETVNETDAAARVDIITKVLDFEKNRPLFHQQYRQESEEIAEKILKAQALLGNIEVSDAIITLAAQICAQGFCAGHRAEIYLLEAAKAIAALAGRNFILPADIEEAALFVLPHRMRQPPQEAPPENSGSPRPENNDNDSLNQEPPDEPPQPGNNENNPPEQPPDRPENNEIENNPPENSEKEEKGKKEEKDNLAPEEEIPEIIQDFILPPMFLDLGKDYACRRGSGKRSLTRTDIKQGRYVRSGIPKNKPEDLAFDATIRAAAPYQNIRAKRGFAIRIEPEDLRQKVREKRIGSTFLFVVDASGSMGARQRMKAVKGAIFSMLQEAYQKRDKVGLIVFRRERAEVLLPVTGSVDLAQKLLRQMPTGGKTPLSEGLKAALTSLATMSKKDKMQEPILILITDGRANSSGDSPQDPVESALQIAGKIRNAKITSVVIDTEIDFIKLGIAERIAKKMNASYYKLDQLSQEQVLHIVKNLGNRVAEY